MFILSDRKKRIRSLLFVLVLGCVLSLGFMLAKTEEITVKAITANGELVRVNREESTGSIYYSSPDRGTVMFWVTNVSGVRHLGLCRNPRLAGPDNEHNSGRDNLRAHQFTEDSLDYKAIKLMVYMISQRNDRIAVSALDTLFNNATSRYNGSKDLSNYYIRFGFAHAIIGYIVDPTDQSELTATDVPFVDYMVGQVKNMVTNNTDAWKMAENYTLYGLEGYPDEWFQDVVWVEVPTGNLEVKKCMQGSGNTCNPPQSGTDFVGVKFEVYNSANIKVDEKTFTSADGPNWTWELTGLPVGTYRVVEANGNSVYNKDVVPEKSALVTEGGLVEVEFHNTLKTGSIKVTKCMGSGEPCSLPREGTNFGGIKFEVWDSAGNKVDEYTLRATEKEHTFRNLKIGVYKVKEAGSNQWYSINTALEVNANVTEGGVAEVKFYNALRTGKITIKKVDAETGGCSSLGKAKLSGTQFKITGNGVDQTKTIGSDCSVEFTGLLWGTYTITEIAVGQGYILNGTPIQVPISETTSSVERTIKNQVIRGDVKFKKVNENGRPMENIPFMIRSKTTGEEHRVVTNSNGIVNTAASFIPHTTSTNGYDSLALSTITHSGFGTWFNGSKTITTTVDNNLGALPYDDYEVFELECNHNQLCRDIGNKRQEFTISSVDAVPKELETFKNDCGASISTSATDNKDDDKFVEADASAEIKDTVIYQAKPWLSLTIKGKLMDKSTGQPLNIGGQEITATQDVIVPENGSGTATLIFSLDASTIAGRDIVVYEELYFGTQMIASHKEMNDANQTVTIVSIRTSASDNDNGDKFVEANASAKIKDHVSYCAKAGDSVTIRGKLMDKKTEQPLNVSGQEITATQDVIVPENGCGEVDLVFSLDASTIAGKDIVVYEELYDEDDKVVTRHEEINDDGQTVTIVKITTSASDNVDNDKFVEANATAKIKDHVNYCAKAGASYTIKGKLMDKAIRQPLRIGDQEVTAEKTVTVPASGCGEADLVFSLDASTIAGKDIVAYEVLYEGDKVVTRHENLNDVNQTVTIVSISTKAVDNKDEDKFVEANSSSQVKDVVEYCAKRDEEFILKSQLVDKKTGEALALKDGVTELSTTIKVPKDGCGSEEIIFYFDSTGLAGNEFVVTQELYYGDDLVAVHDDLEDEDQTVTVISLSTVATDNYDKDKYIEATEGQKVRDVVEYCVRPGRDFTIKGVLMNKATGRELLIDGQKFKQEAVVNSENGCGSVVLTFPLDATFIAGIDVVAFEYMYYEDELVLSHNYFDDVEQTTSTISLWTYATNKKGDEKIIVMDKNSVIKDKIKYSFKTGAKYTIEGILMNKATGQPIQVNGKTIRQSIEIDASKSLSGETEMSYTFDSTGLNGVEIVIFDYVYEDGELILSHTDVNNANQTVKLVAPPPNTGFMAIVTGNGAVAHGTRIAIVVGFAAMAGYVFKRKRSRSHKIGW